MLNSILKHNPRNITLDRIKFNDKNDITFTIDPSAIEKIASNHYQQVGTIDPTRNKFDPNIPLRQPWNDIYLPKTNIPITASAALTDPITYEELSRFNDITQ